jgi:hypothetical protein
MTVDGETSRSRAICRYAEQERRRKKSLLGRSGRRSQYVVEKV